MQVNEERPSGEDEAGKGIIIKILEEEDLGVLVEDSLLPENHWGLGKNI